VTAYLIYSWLLSTSESCALLPQPEDPPCCGGEGLLGPLERPEHRWKDNNEVDDVDWNDLSPDRDKWRAVIHVVMNLRVS
jgi:hypothetical protein